MNAVRAILVVACSALLLAIVAPSMFENPPWPYSGVSQQDGPIGARLTVTIERNSPAYRAGLRTSDALGCLSARNNSRLFDVYAPNLLYTPDPISLCAFRHGTWRNVTFAPTPMPPPGLMYGTLWIATLRLAVFIIFLIVGSALVVARPSLMTWLLFGYCCANVPWAAAQGMLLWLPGTSYATAKTLLSVLTYSAGPLLALFTLVVPENGVPRGWRGKTFWTVVALSLGYFGLSVATDLATTVNFGPLTSWIDEGFTALTVLLVVARLVTMERPDRARFGWAAFAIMFGIVCNVVRNDVLNNVISIAGGVLTVVMPLCLMYAILRRHVIDVRFVLSRTVVYGIVTTLVVAIIGVVDWATSAYLSEVRTALAIDAAVTIALGLALHRGYNWIESAIDAVLFRKKHAAEAYLRRAARSLLRADGEETIDAVLVGDPYEALDLSMAALFRARGNAYACVASVGWTSAETVALARGHDLVRFLAVERARIAVADLRAHVRAQFLEAGAVPAVAIPVLCDDELFGFAVYGLHRDGTQLDPDEIESLEHLCEMAAQAYTVVELRRYRGRVSVVVPALEAP